ncbi:MAG: VWA domain-containing protein [Elusimicrobia bacterium]|nr:VWA domain-containing protein [Candidatus Liberimonas magnetica]
MRFNHPNILFLMLFIPLWVLLFIYVLRHKISALKTFGNIALIEKLSSLSIKKQIIKFLFILIALFCFIISLSQPQIGTKLVEVKQKGADVVFLIDVSNSMLAEDTASQGTKGASRLARAKKLLSLLINNLQGNRLGIIAFAGNAFWQCPLTLDLSSVNLFLDIMDTSLIPLPGTGIGNAIRLANKGLSKTEPKSKAIILITDGEDHNSNPVEAAEESAKEGIKIFCIGFGNPQGEPIPLKDDKGTFTGYKKNKKGDVIMSKLDESLLTNISSLSDGQYFRASDGAINIAILASKIKGLKGQQLSSNINREYEDRFQYPLFFGFLLLLVEFLIPDRKSVISDKL